MDADEIEAVRAVYYLPGECCFDGKTNSADPEPRDSLGVLLSWNYTVCKDNKVTINLSVDVPSAAGADAGATDVKVPVKVIFFVGSDYPNTLPDFSMFSEHLNRDSVSNIKAEVSENFKDFAGEPLILAISSFIYEAAKSEFETIMSSHEASKNARSARSLESVTGDVDLWTAVLHIDHMRTKNKYCKTLEKWAEELHLTGRIVFLRRLIFVLLQGCQENIKDFIIRLRTVNVDVDSKGHSCKERMMKVLSEDKSTSSLRIPSFQRCELTAESEFKNLFSQNGLDNHWKSVLPLLIP